MKRGATAFSGRDSFGGVPGGSRTHDPLLRRQLPSFHSLSFARINSESCSKSSESGKAVAPFFTVLPPFMTWITRLHFICQYT